MLKNITFIAASLCLSASAFAYDSLEELMEDIGRKQMEALETYIAENPDADDINEAKQQLIYGLVAQENIDEALAILEGMYEALPDDKSELDLSMAFGEIVVPIIQLHQMDERTEEGIAFIAKVRKDFSKHNMIKTINDALDEFAVALDKPGIGDPVDIQFEAIDGRKVDVADMKGKVVLLDFWATWCAPCIRAMPEVIALYDEFHEKGFDVIGISLDSEKKRLEDYIKREKIAWPQYFDGKGWENDIAAKFGVEAIPATHLIGPDGLIAAVDASGDELREKIAELLKAAE